VSGFRSGMGVPDVSKWDGFTETRPGMPKPAVGISWVFGVPDLQPMASADVGPDMRHEREAKPEDSTARLSTEPCSVVNSLG
jgi:hypothetical protein